MKNFIEIQNWGFNTLIIFSFLTLIFGIFQGYGFVKQGQKIWRNKSTKSIATVYFSFLLFYFIAFMIYGLSKRSLSMTINGLLFLPCAYIMTGILKFKRLDWKDILSIVLSGLAVPIMIFIKEKDLLIFVLLMVSLATMIAQLFTMVKNKSAGVVEIKFLFIFSLTAVFWLIYAVAVKNWPLIVFNIMAIIVYGSMAILHRRYEKI